MFILNMYVSWNLLLYYLCFESSSDTYAVSNKGIMYFLWTKNALRWNVRALGFVTGSLNSVLKQIFRDPVLHCWNGSNKWLVCSTIAGYGFVSVKLCLLPSLLLAACGRMDKIILCSAGQRGRLWASALLPTNAGRKLQPQSFQALYSQPVSFPFSEQ